MKWIRYPLLFHSSCSVHYSRYFRSQLPLSVWRWTSPRRSFSWHVHGYFLNTNRFNTLNKCPPPFALGMEISVAFQIIILVWQLSVLPISDNIPQDLNIQPTNKSTTKDLWVPCLVGTFQGCHELMLICPR
jgi:hypothetical protein